MASRVFSETLFKIVLVSLLHYWNETPEAGVKQEAITAECECQIFSVLNCKSQIKQPSEKAYTRRLGLVCDSRTNLFLDRGNQAQTQEGSTALS